MTNFATYDTARPLSGNCTSFIGSMRTLIAEFWAAHSCRARIARESRQLQKLSERALRDIGLSRPQVGYPIDDIDSLRGELRALGYRLK